MKDVFARVVKASQKQSKGCSYGLEFEAKDRMRVYAVLDELGIAYRRN